MISSNLRKSRAFFGQPMLAMALALGGVAAMAASPAAHAQEVQPELKPSGDFRKAFQPLFEAYNTARADTALQARALEVRGAEGEARAAGRAELAQRLAADLALLQSLRDQIDNQSDRYLWGQFAINYGVLTDNPDLQLTGITEETASGLQTQTRKAQLANAKAMIHFDRSEFAEARQAFQAALDAGSTDANLRNNIVVTYIREENRAAALEYINAMIEDQAAVGSPSEELLLRAYSLARELQAADSNDYAVNLVRYYPTAKNWANAIVLVRQDPSLSDEAVLDLQRLMVRTDAVQNRGDITAIVNYADYRKRPQEVLDAIALGIEKGYLDPGEALVVEDRKQAQNQVAVDQRGELASLDSDARASSASLTTAVVAGDAFLNYGQPVKAEELYRIAMEKPGADVDELKTRIGIAQLDQGRIDDALATFADVSGNRAAVANLWRVYATQQGS